MDANIYEAPEPFRSRYADPYDAEVAYADELVSTDLEIEHVDARGFDEFVGFRAGWWNYYDWCLDCNGEFRESDGRYLTDVFTDEAVSFIERHNLTIRQGSSYLSRRTPCHARYADLLAGHMELLQCYYNFIRSHRALKFGREVRTPAMQAGLARRKLRSREIFGVWRAASSLCPCQMDAIGLPG